MGHSTYNATDWAAYAGKTRTMKTADIFASTKVDSYLDPKNITIRESRDSAANPNSTPVQLWLDVTGSMGVLADQIAKNGLGVTFQGLLDRKVISDPHVLVGGIGDLAYDRSPCQATQFEAGVPELTAQIEKIWLEHGGGGNHTESYDLAWWFAALRTATDSWDKRKKKGYLFTIGDEEAPAVLRARDMTDKVGATLQADLTSAEALEMAQRQWNVFHILVEQGSHARRYGADHVLQTWTPLLGQNVIRLSDVEKLGEVIVSTIAVIEGSDKAVVAKSWGGGTDLVVARAVQDLVANPGGGIGVGPSTGLVRL